MVDTVLLSSTYFGPIQWYQKLFRARKVILDQHEHFVKQTYRNRCVIAAAQGEQTLSVPTCSLDAHGNGKGKTPMYRMGVSEHGNWRHLHWNALCSAYGESPFFMYYADDIMRFFQDKTISLFNFNYLIMMKICELLDFRPTVTLSTSYIGEEELAEMDGVEDYRNVIRPKNALSDKTFCPAPYYQVFAHKYGFRPNLSILDLLFNEGNEAVYYL